MNGDCRENRKKGNRISQRVLLLETLSRVRAKRLFKNPSPFQHIQVPQKEAFKWKASRLNFSNINGRMSINDLHCSPIWFIMHSWILYQIFWQIFCQIVQRFYEYIARLIHISLQNSLSWSWKLTNS